MENLDVVMSMKATIQFDNEVLCHCAYLDHSVSVKLWETIETIH